MAILVLVFSLLFASCGKKENALSEKRAFSSFERKSFILIPHEPEKLQLRKKLLNAIVDPSQELKRDDEEELLKDLTAGERAGYLEKEKHFAKVIVSHPDNTEVYFIPQNIPVDVLIDQLGLGKDRERSWKWVRNKSEKTQGGITFYLLSLSHADLMKNDQDFYEENVDLGNNFSQQTLNIDHNKKMEIFIKAEFFVQSEEVRTLEGRAPRCHPRDMESGGCGRCTYKKVSPGNGYRKTHADKMEDWAVGIKINEHIFKLSDLVVEKISAESLKVTLDMNAVSPDKEAEVSIVKLSPVIYPIHVSGFDYSPACLDRNHTTVENLATRSDLAVAITLRGRGENLKRIVL